MLHQSLGAWAIYQGSKPVIRAAGVRLYRIRAEGEGGVAK